MDERELDRDRRRVGTVFLAVALLAPVLATLPEPGDGLARPVVVYVVLTLVVAAAVRGTWQDVHRSAGAAAVTYVTAVVVLRHAGGGAASGLAPLLLLPLFWCSLIGRRRDVTVAVLATALALAMPIVLVGGELYPATEWRRAVIWLAVTPAVGAATLRLRQQVERSRVTAVAEARTDLLTGCLNRRGLDEVARRELARTRRGRQPIAVALLDLDRFKAFNDSRGHDAGDELLRTASRTWQAALRETDVLARWGGEEFVVLLPDTTSAEAVIVLDRLRAATPLGQTCSIGLTMVAADDEDVADAVTRADTALYAAKEGGRDRLVTSW